MNRVRNSYPELGKEKSMLLLTETPAIDTNIVTELVNLVKNVMSLFSEFPLNVLLIAGLCFVAFGLFGKARSVV